MALLQNEVESGGVKRKILNLDKRVCKNRVKICLKWHRKEDKNFSISEEGKIRKKAYKGNMREGKKTHLLLTFFGQLRGL